MNSDKVVSGIIHYLKTENLLDAVPKLIRELQKLEQQFKQIAIVESATQLNPEEKAKLETAINKRFGKQDEIEYKVVPQLLGGLKVICGDQIWDLSVKNRLEKIYEQI